jgi:beta-xylosidase
MSNKFYCLFFLHLSIFLEISAYNNPVNSGFYPEPTICSVGEDYYLVNSSGNGIESTSKAAYDWFDYEFSNE